MRARLNEYRRAFHDEAIQSGNAQRITQAELLYGVVIHNPERDQHGNWSMAVSIKDRKIDEALQDILPPPLSPSGTQYPTPGSSADVPMQGARAISEFMSGDDE